ncbi:MAG: protein kinase domain-containing protein [Gemmatimonadaceae bacterium]
MKSCPRCARSYPDAEHFCSRDGTSLVETSPPAEMVGRVIDGRYRVLRMIAEGGMGRIYLAEHVRTKRPVALKILDRQVARDDRAIARFTAEAMIASGVSHPNIAAIHDSGETEDGLLYLALEYVDGEPLSDVLQREGQLPPARAAHITREVAHALDAAHRAGVVHRDLKPANIILSSRATGADWPRLVDFGIALSSRSAGRDQPSGDQTLGTPDYMSPEQLQGEIVDSRSDVYSLALVAYHMLSGALPFAPANTPSTLLARLTDRPRRLDEVRPDIVWPSRLQHVMDRALSTDPEERHRGALQLADDVSSAVDLMEHEPATRATLRRGTRVRTTEITSVPESAPPLSPRRRSPLLAAAALVAVIVSLIIWRGGGAANVAALEPAARVASVSEPVESPTVGSDSTLPADSTSTATPAPTSAAPIDDTSPWTNEMRAQQAAAHRDLLLARRSTRDGNYAEARTRLLAGEKRLAPLLGTAPVPDSLVILGRELARAAESNRSACAAEQKLARLRGERGAACR